MNDLSHRLSREYEKIVAYKIRALALTFGDVSGVPAYSRIVPAQVDLSTRLAEGICLKIPIISAQMDTVTRAPMAIAMAKNGGIGIIDKNQSIDAQVNEVEMVKGESTNVIHSPITAKPYETIGEIKKRSIAFINENPKKFRRMKFVGMPVVNDNGIVVGIITSRDVKSCNNDSERVEKYMTKNLVKANPGVSEEKALDLMRHAKVEKLLLVNRDGGLAGMICQKDTEVKQTYKNAVYDNNGRLLAGAAIGVGKPAFERAEALVYAGANLIVIDTAHGHNKAVIDATRKLKPMLKTWVKSKHLDYVALCSGNISTKEAAYALCRAGADIVKIGQGPGSICSTRETTGCGTPQITATTEAYAGVRIYFKETGRRVTLITDGGMTKPGEMVKAFVAGADAVMLGMMLAGTAESPGTIEMYEGRQHKRYRGMGSEEAMSEGFAIDRYFADPNFHKASEGVVGMVTYKGPVAPLLLDWVAGIKQGFGYLGCKNIKEVHEKAQFWQQTQAGFIEGKPHDIHVVKDR